MQLRPALSAKVSRTRAGRFLCLCENERNGLPAIPAPRAFLPLLGAPSGTIKAGFGVSDERAFDPFATATPEGIAAEVYAAMARTVECSKRC